jgi:thioredoxin-related protein
MKIRILILVLSMAGTLGLQAEENLPWLDNYETAIEQAKKSGKPVLLVYMNSFSCSPCKRFERDVLKSDPFKSFVQAKVIPLKVDFAEVFRTPPSKRGTTMSDIRKQSKVPATLSYNGWPYVYLLSPQGAVLRKLKERRPLDAEGFVKDYETFLAGLEKKSRENPDEN